MRPRPPEVGVEKRGKDDFFLNLLLGVRSLTDDLSVRLNLGLAQLGFLNDNGVIIPRVLHSWG